MTYTTTKPTYKNATRARWMAACERLIIERIPELRGIFARFGLWDTLYYLYTCNGITPEIAAERATQGIDLNNPPF